MDKYQEAYLKSEAWLSFSVNNLGCRESGNYVSIYLDKDILKIKQDEDITKTKYMLSPNQEFFVKSISLLKNGVWEECQNKIAIIDFDDRVEKIKLSFEHNIVDDYEMSIEYIEADKNAYYAKQNALTRQKLIEKASIRTQTGNDLVNIYFQPCSDDYFKTEITLYSSGNILAKYTVNENCFFQAITNLAYGTYEFVLKQFDISGNVLLETDKYSFAIIRPSSGGILGF